jgi:hypothetical protein
MNFVTKIYYTSEKGARKDKSFPNVVKNTFILQIIEHIHNYLGIYMFTI